MTPGDLFDWVGTVCICIFIIGMTVAVARFLFS